MGEQQVAQLQHMNVLPHGFIEALESTPEGAQGRPWVNPAALAKALPGYPATATANSTATPKEGLGSPNRKIVVGISDVFQIRSAISGSA